MDIPKIRPIAAAKAASPIQAVRSRYQQATGGKTGGDKVSLSENARLVNEAREKIKAMDPVDEAKVAEIKARIEAGTYRVDAQDLAGKILLENFIAQSD